VRSIGLPEIIVLLGAVVIGGVIWLAWPNIRRDNPPALGSRQCPHCGQRIPDFGSFCAICGQKIV